MVGSSSFNCCRNDTRLKYQPVAVVLFWDCSIGCGKGQTEEKVLDSWKLDMVPMCKWYLFVVYYLWLLVFSYSLTKLFSCHFRLIQSILLNNYLLNCKKRYHLLKLIDCSGELCFALYFSLTSASDLEKGFWSQKLVIISS